VVGANSMTQSLVKESHGDLKELKKKKLTEGLESLDEI